MKSSFSIKFNTLRKERKLSIREIALMTGVSTREVKKWEKHNRDVIKELKHLWRRTEKGKEKDNLQREIWNREGYLRRIVTYFETGVWLDLFWGPDMENRVAYRTKARAYDNDGYLKINYDSDERL